MRLSPDGLRHVIRCLIHDGESHRAAIFEEINREFVRQAVEFFTQVAHAKLQGEDLAIADDWYEHQMLQIGRYAKDKNEVAVHAGIPMKTIENIHEATNANVVLDASLRNHRALRRTIDQILAAGDRPSITLTIKLRGVGVDLSLEESLIVINSLAVKREQIRGGMWSSAGKQVEAPLMAALCLLHQVDRRHWRLAEPGEFPHQIDFVLMSHGKQYLCEVKLMGKGNPESAKAAHAHDASLLVADRLSEQAKQSLTKNNIEWVELAERDGYTRFGRVLDRFNIERAQAAGLDALDEIIEQAIEYTTG